jgi:hypothetical protein
VGLGFIIMQIGNPDLDQICRDAIVPAMTACGLDPKRVDKHNAGGLLKNEIVSFIQRADIVVADLTNERPNCYLEVGYAMGLDKFSSLVLTAREDHRLGSPLHVVGGPKVHFDLEGYDILFWTPSDIAAFRTELEKRIRRRQVILAPSSATTSAWDEDWTATQRERASEGLSKAGFLGAMEVRFTLLNTKLQKSPTELLAAARNAEIHAFGWPIALVLDSPGAAPRPRSDGIFAEIVGGPGHPSYDYWAIRRNGDFYLLHSLLEDDMRPKRDTVFFDTRITRVTETLLYCARLYERLAVSGEAIAQVEITHSGLMNRVMRSSNPTRHLFERTATDDRVTTQVRTTLSAVPGNLVSLVNEIVTPLFEVFDFFKISDSVIAEIVNGFVEDVGRS